MISTPVLRRRPPLRTNTTRLSRFLAVALPLAMSLVVIGSFMPLAAILIYVALFMIIAARRADVCLALIIATAPFQNDISGDGPVKFSIAEVNLLLTFVLMIIRNLGRRKAIVLGPIFIPVVLYLTACVFSSFSHYEGKEALTSFGQMVVYLLVAVIVFATYPENPEDLQLGFDALLAVCVMLAISVTITGEQYLFGLHKNGIGASLATAAVIAMELWIAARTKKRKRWLFWAMMILVIGLVMTRSRGAWMSTMVGIFVILILRRRIRLFFQLALVLIPAVALGWFFIPEAGRESAMNFKVDDNNIQARLVIINFASEKFSQNPIFGVGLGLRKQIDATNLFWVTLAETGLVGMAAFVLLQGSVAWLVWRVRSRITVLHPQFSIVAICGGIFFGRLAHGMVDHYWGRGPNTIAWASVGMVTAMYCTSKRRAKRRREEMPPPSLEQQFMPGAFT